MERDLPTNRERGFSLIEAMVSILIFSFGILGLIALQATAINFSSDAKYRMDATFLANQLLGQLAVADPALLAAFAHRPGGNTVCGPTGGDSSNAIVTGWLSQVAAALPNAPASKQQVKVDSADNFISVTICWQPQQGTQHHHTVASQIQWQ